MSDLQTRFEQAQTDVKSLSERPSNMTLLRLYALFKQGSEATPTATSLASPTSSAATSTKPGRA